jgi:glycosyltransferase involved in cell wall biosynthesis
MTTPLPLRVAAIGTRGVPSHYSGLETSCEGLYAALAARGHRMTVYCRRGHVNTEAEHHRGIELLRVPAIRARSLETLSHVAASLADASLRRRFDVLHLHAEAPGLFAPLASRLGVPLVATVQGLDWQRAKWRSGGSSMLLRAERSLVRHADEIIVVSAALREYFEAEYGRETTYIPNGVEEPPRVGDPDTLLQRWGLCTGEYLVYVARLVPEKRVEDLIRAFRSIDTRCRLAIVGEGGYSHEYVTRVRELAERDPRVVFTGRQEGDALRALFQGAAAYVLPSEMEGLPMSLLEAMVQGVPAVASDIPPNRELLGPVAGYDLFFPPHDVRALADRLRRVLASPRVYAEVAARARRRARESYSWPAQAEATEAVFRNALSGGRTRGVAAPVSGSV